MLKNSFIPISIPILHDYLMNKFSINIYEIPINDWSNLICNNYCKNFIDDHFCLRKHKKMMLDMENKGLCSKCCEKKGIKRSKVYKQRKKKTKHILDNTEDSDSGVYTENDDNRNGENFSLNKNYKNNDYNNNLSEFKKRIFMKIKFLIFFKKLYLNNKNKSNNYISFGSLDVEINNNNNYSSLFSNKVYNKI